MNELPFGFTDALHIDEPFPWRNIVFTLLLLWLLYRFVRSLKRDSPPKRPSAPARQPRSRFGQQISALRKRYRRSKDFRAGCHELSEILRQHFEAKRKKPFSVLTVGEIQEEIGDGAVSRLFSLLANLQFSRQEPSKSDFEGACDLALDVSKVSRR